MVTKQTGVVEGFCLSTVFGVALIHTAGNL